ncbi:MAG: selenide, water dikinase SelD [Bacteroidales bacterium]|nr:selenide, water dikinase SelD [Bacteroidales bacterium]MCF8403407.1 selenide, water dikinase SelD [Bacteroidales bacterium]
MMRPIYLDYNATTPIDKEVAEAMQPYLSEYFGNPSSTHEYGMITKKAIINARSQVAALINAQPDEIIFTSGGTESNNYALKGVAFAHKLKGKHIITSQIEHPAIIEVCKFLEKNGFEVSYTPVDKFGTVNPEDIRKAIRPDTILISIMHANNEVGTIQPIAAIGELAHKNNIIFHSDAAQSIGKVKVDVMEMGVDLMSVAGHKLYAPKGTGALFVKRGTILQKLIHGADHEMNFRAGTENVLEVVGLGKACELARRDLEKNQRLLKEHSDLLFQRLSEAISDVKRNGHPENCLPNTLSMSFRGVEANTLLSELNGVAASAGAACHTDSIDISSVLQAMKIPLEYAMGTIRFSTGKYTNREDIINASDQIIKTIAKLRSKSVPEQIEIDTKEIKLTQFTHGLGCACKIRPQYLEKVLQGFPVINDPNVLVSINSSDDAAIYKISDEIALIQTVDFFTPIVDDPYSFGAIAAANALSDVYAMGGQPLFALNIVAFPDNRLPVEVLQQILKGASDKAREAGIHILGGHTIEDNEPKFGMAVTGKVHPSRILRNNNLQPEDVLLLTKPLGSGILSTGIKRGLVSEETKNLIIALMSELNAKSADIARDFPVNACTDITGFGLLGHLKEMSISSKMNVEIYAGMVPIVQDAFELASNDIIPGGTKNNLDFVKETVEWDNSISQAIKYILCDAQTSGGLLFSIPGNIADNFILEFKKQNIDFCKAIGKVVNKGEGKIFVKI